LWYVNLQDFTSFHSFFLQIFAMKPKQPPQHNRQRDLFRPELSKVINPAHPLVKIGPYSGLAATRRQETEVLSAQMEGRAPVGIA
jgi:hypothetical protein